MCSTWLSNNPYKIGGFDENGNPLNVQIDESKFAGRRKYNRGRVHEHEEWVFGGICPVQNRMFMALVINRTAATLIPLITKWIEFGSLVVSDGWPAYARIKQIDVRPRYLVRVITIRYPLALEFKVRPFKYPQKHF